MEQTSTETLDVWLKENDFSVEEAKKYLKLSKRRRDRDRSRSEYARAWNDAYAKKSESDKQKEEEERKASYPQRLKEIQDEQARDEERLQFLKELLEKHEDMLFVDDRYDEDSNKVLGISINCNDWFAFACSDSEPLTWKGLLELKKMMAADPRYGMEKWCCKQRDQKPEPYEQAKLRKLGLWEEWMDSLKHGIDSYD
jgi:hypothetical protein